MKVTAPVKLFISAILVSIVAIILSASILSDLFTVYSWYLGIALSLPLFILSIVSTNKNQHQVVQILSTAAIASLLMFGILITWLVSVLPGV